MARRVAAVGTYTQVQVRKRWGNILGRILARWQGLFRFILGWKKEYSGAFWEGGTALSPVKDGEDRAWTNTGCLALNGTVA